MNKQTDSVIEMVAGVIGVVAFTTETTSFSYRHSIIGAMLVLYVLPGFRRSKTLHASLLFSCIVSLLTLLTVGKAIDWLRDTYVRLSVERDLLYVYLWLVLSLLVFLADLVIIKKKQKTEVTHEAH